VIARMSLLIAAGLAFTLLAGLPARFLVGDQAMFFCLSATFLCLIPGVLTILWIGPPSRQDAGQASLKLLGASGLRMFVVLSVAVLLYYQSPWFQGEDSFLFWVVGAYLFLLAVEVLLIVRPPRPKPSEVNDPRG